MNADDDLVEDRADAVEAAEGNAFTASDGLWQVLALIEQPVAILDPTTSIEWCSEAFGDLASRAPETLVGRRFAEALGTERIDRVTAVLSDVASSNRTLGRARISATDWAGTTRRLAISAAVTELWGPGTHVLVLVENKTNERRTLYAQDPAIGAPAAGLAALSALPSRATFHSLFENSLRKAQRNNVPVAVLSCGLDGYLNVVERLGRDAGETLIAATAARLAHALRGEDLLVHDRDDQFIIVADAVPNSDVVAQVVRRLRAAVTEPIVLSNIEVRVGLSVGFVLGFGPERAMDLLHVSERALSHARSGGVNQTASSDDADHDVASVEAAAIDWNELAGSESAENPAPLSGRGAPDSGMLAQNMRG